MDAMAKSSTSFEQAYRQTKVFDWLNNGGNINDPRATKSNHTLLMMACIENHEQIVAELLKRKPDIDGKGTGGKNALHLAAIHCNKGCIELLLKAGARADIRTVVDDTDYTSYDGMTALEIIEAQLANGKRPRLPEMARMLREAEARQAASS